MENYFVELYQVNVNDKVEKKNGLSYVSWPYAWAEVKKRHPDATFTIYEREGQDGPVNYFTDGRTCWVKTGLTINGIEHIEFLPVMDFKNRSILLDNITSMDVNKAIQRSLTKAAARHGLGLYIYAGEDLPEGEPEPENRPEKAEIDKTRPETPASVQTASAVPKPDEKKLARSAKITELKRKLGMDDASFNSKWAALVNAGLVVRKKWSEMTDEEFVGFLTAMEANFAEAV
jgi:hypothetical protein